MNRPGAEPTLRSGASPVARCVLVALAALAALLTGGLELGGRLAAGSSALAPQPGVGTPPESSREVRPAARGGDVRLRHAPVPVVTAALAAPSAPASGSDGPTGPPNGDPLAAPLQALGDADPRPASRPGGSAVEGPSGRGPPVTTGT